MALASWVTLLPRCWICSQHSSCPHCSEPSSGQSPAGSPVRHFLPKLLPVPVWLLLRPAPLSLPGPATPALCISFPPHPLLLLLSHLLFLQLFLPRPTTPPVPLVLCPSATFSGSLLIIWLKPTTSALCSLNLLPASFFSRAPVFYCAMFCLFAYYLSPPRKREVFSILATAKSLFFVFCFTCQSSLHIWDYPQNSISSFFLIKKKTI